MHLTVGIVDANAVLSSVDNDCRYDRTSRLLRSTLSDSTTLYAADHVWGEIYETLPKIAASSPVPLKELRARFETFYLPAIRFVTVTMPDELHPLVKATVDLDDRPTGQLAHLIAPVIVFSGDKHLRNPGFAPERASPATSSLASGRYGCSSPRGPGSSRPVGTAGNSTGKRGHHAEAIGADRGASHWTPTHLSGRFGVKVKLKDQFVSCNRSLLGASRERNTAVGLGRGTIWRCRWLAGPSGPIWHSTGSRAGVSRPCSQYFDGQ